MLNEYTFRVVVTCNAQLNAPRVRQSIYDAVFPCLRRVPPGVGLGLEVVTLSADRAGYWCQNCSRVEVERQGQVCTRCMELISIGGGAPPESAPVGFNCTCGSDPLGRCVVHPKPARRGLMRFVGFLNPEPLPVVVGTSVFWLCVFLGPKLLKTLFS